MLLLRTLFNLYWPLISNGQFWVNSELIKIVEIIRKVFCHYSLEQCKIKTGPGLVTILK